jgi:hypothetical protein
MQSRLKMVAILSSDGGASIGNAGAQSGET